LAPGPDPQRLPAVERPVESPASVAGVVDWDWSCLGPTPKDLALGLVEWAFPDGSQGPVTATMDAFLGRYNATAAQPIAMDDDLIRWMMFACLSDAATFWSDRLGEPGIERDIGASFMYAKYEHYSRELGHPWRR
jgi:hypothetical protein